jgi:hypothetical protein
MKNIRNYFLLLLSLVLFIILIVPGVFVVSILVIPVIVYFLVQKRNILTQKFV